MREVVDRGEDIPFWSERCATIARLICHHWPSESGRHFYCTRSVLKTRGDIHCSELIALQRYQLAFGHAMTDVVCRQMASRMGFVLRWINSFTTSRVMAQND